MTSRAKRDIWSVPPGGPAGPRRGSRTKPIVAFTLVVSLGVGGSLLYASMKSSTAVSAEDALAEFTAANAASSGKPAPSHRTRKDPRGVRGSRADEDRSRSGSRAGGTPAATRSTATSDRPEQRQGGDRAPASPPETKPRQRPAAATVGPPEDGVYAWAVDGYEQAPGVRRDLPSRSHRVITYDGGNAWSEHHIFSEQREQWMKMSISPEGVAAREVRNRVEMGPVEVDNTIVFDPVMFVARYPSRVGQTWQGSWSGKTSGSYTARTFEKTTVVIEGEEIEVYASEVVMDMRGEVEGRAITRSWYSLEHRMVVKQYQKMDVTSGPGDYRSEWTGQVLSLRPQR